jgi:hypothetical protein
MKWSEIPAPVAKWGLIALCVVLVLAWLRFAPPTSPWSPRSIAGYVLPESKVITKIERVDVPGPVRIRTIVKEKIVEKYKDLPIPATVANPAAVVTAVADIPPSPDGGVAVAVLTPGVDNVGVGSIEYRPAARRFLQIKREFVGEAYYYLAGDRTAQASLGVLPVRLGPVEVKLKAGIDLMREDSSLKGFAAVGIEVHF